MNDQYYTADPQSESKPVPCAFPYRGYGLNFMTDAGVFSKGELDVGSRLLLDALPALSGDVLDLGCGWGAIGVAVARANKSARVVMADVNRRALGLAQENCLRNGVTAEVIESDGMSAVMGRRFDAVVTNPPIRAGKQVIYKMFADAAVSLKDGGALYLVIRKQQGAESCVKYLRTLFGQVEKLDKSGGFWVLKASEPVGEKGAEENEV
ncbi:MAG: class I SAM-dependent methyltransferase [Clostridia bacterium]|nr:class I SAM-dependent methyltransferase [Clostridia bacterium]